MMVREMKKTKIIRLGLVTTVMKIKTTMKIIIVNGKVMKILVKRTISSIAPPLIPRIRRQRCTSVGTRGI